MIVNAYMLGEVFAMPTTKGGIGGNLWAPHLDRGMVSSRMMSEVDIENTTNDLGKLLSSAMVRCVNAVVNRNRSSLRWTISGGLRIMTVLEEDLNSMRIFVGRAFQRDTKFCVTTATNHLDSTNTAHTIRTSNEIHSRDLLLYLSSLLTGEMDNLVLLNGGIWWITK